MSLERTENVTFNVENVENNEEFDKDINENNAREIIKDIEQLRAEQKEKMNKIKSYLMDRYEPDDIIKQCMQIGVSNNTNKSEKNKYSLIDINKCVTRNEVVIISYKTGNVYTMEITPTITFQCIVDYILNETDEFIDDNDKQYVFMLDEKSLCDAYPTTEKFLQTSIEHNNKPKDN
jgi:hypothetical protein